MKHLLNTLLVILIGISYTANSQCIADYSFTIPPGSYTVNFKDLSKYPGSFNVGYSWWFDDGSSSTQKSPTHTYNQAGTYIVYLSISDSQNNCFDSTSHYVTVPAPHPPCTADFSYQINPSGSNSDVYFTNQSSNYSDSTQFTFDFGDGNTDTFKATSGNLNRLWTYAPGTYIVTLSLVDSLYNNTCSYSDTITIPVNHPPCTADFSYQITPSGNNSIVNFTNTSSNYANSSQFTFDFGDGNSRTFPATDPDLNAQWSYAPGTYLVSLNIVDTLLNLSCLKTDTLQIPHWPNCVAGFSYQEAGDSVSFTNQAQNYTSVMYYFGDGDSSSLEDPIHKYAQSNIYIVEQLVRDSLSNCTDRYFDTLHVTVPNSCLAYFTPAIDTNKANLLYLVNQSSELSSHQYSWDFGDGTVIQKKKPIHHYQDYGSYPICLTISDPVLGCINTYCDTVGLDSNSKILLKSNGFTVNVLDGGMIGIEENAALSEVQIYPNPVNDQLTIDLGRDDIHPTYVLYRIDGRRVKSGKLQQKISRLSLSELSGGLYLLSIREGNQSTLIKVLKQ